MREAALYEKLDGGIVVCELCAHRCRIRPGKPGVCGVRENDSGTLRTLVDDRVVAIAIDPARMRRTRCRRSLCGCGEPLAGTTRNGPRSSRGSC